MENRNRGTSLMWVLFLIFLVLKLTGNIDWSWALVTLPLWFNYVVNFIFYIIGILFGLIARIFGK